MVGPRSCVVAVSSLVLPLLLQSQPAVLESGVTPSQSTWAFDTPLEKVSKQVKFFMRVKREGNLSRFGTFDYYFRIRVLRPDGTEVWNTSSGFDEKGYSEGEFTFPVLFWERSADKSNPSFGVWKVRMALEEKDSKKAVFSREFKMNFTDGRNRPQSAGPAVLEVGMTPNQSTWAFDTPLDRISKQVKFFMRVQREGNLSRFGTFDYYFRVRVSRPDGTVVWNTSAGFDEKGYSEGEFTFPTLFWERSEDRSNPAFGIWKIFVAMEEKDSKKAVSSKEYSINFTDGRKK